MLTLTEIMKEFDYAEITGQHSHEYVPVDYAWVQGAITRARKAKLIPEPPATVLDLGSGDGRATAIFANHGYNAHGIEIHGGLVIIARQNAQRAGIQAKFAQGNYFPPELRKQLENNWHVIKDDSQDPYQELGIKINQIDIFYAYPYPTQLPSITQLFKQYAKKGAKLILIGDEETWNKEVNMQGTVLPASEDRNFTVYTKA